MEKSGRKIWRRLKGRNGGEWKEEIEDSGRRRFRRGEGRDGN